jgi:hypothetical protein
MIEERRQQRIRIRLLKQQMNLSLRESLFLDLELYSIRAESICWQQQAVTTLAALLPIGACFHQLLQSGIITVFFRIRTIMIAHVQVLWPFLLLAISIVMTFGTLKVVASSPRSTDFIDCSHPCHGGDVNYELVPHFRTFNQVDELYLQRLCLFS